MDYESIIAGCPYRGARIGMPESRMANDRSSENAADLRPSPAATRTAR